MSVALHRASHRAARLAATAPAALIATPPWRRGVLSRPGYLRYVVAMILGATGWWTSKIAQDWLLLKLTNNVAWVGMAASLQFAPILIFGLYGGVLADRFNVRHLLIVAQAGILVVSLSLGTLAITGYIRPWHILVAAGCIGLLQVLEQPARASMIAQLAGPDINQALSVNSIAFQSAGFWGPALSAIVVAGLGPGPAFWANAVGCACTIALISSVPTRTPDRTQVTERPRLRDGLVSIRNSTEIGWTMGLSAVFALLALSSPLIYAGMARGVFNAGVSGYSLFSSLGAIGCILGSLISARRAGKTRLRHLTGLMFGVGLLQISGAFSPSVATFGVLLTVTAATATIFQLRANALVQLSTDPSARGRVMGLYILIVFGGMSIGGPIVGRIIDVFGARATLAGLGVTMITLTGLLALAMARYMGQRLTLSKRGPLIVEPDIPRDAWLAELALESAAVTLERTDQVLNRVDMARAA